MKQIEFIRGDTFFRKVPIKYADGTNVEKEHIETLFFTIREYPDNLFPILIEKKIDDFVISEGYIHIILKPEDTEKLEYGTYSFDLEITLKGVPKIRKTKKGYLRLTEETTIHKNEVGE